MIRFSVGDESVPLVFMQMAFRDMVRAGDTDNTAGNIMKYAKKRYKESLAVTERERLRRPPPRRTVTDEREGV